MGRKPQHPKQSSELSSEVEEVLGAQENGPQAAREVHPTYRYFAAAVRSHRRRLGLTQLELANKAGVTPGTVYVLEACRQNPSLQILVAVATALDRELGDLLPQSGFRAANERNQDIATKLDDQIRRLQAVVEELREPTSP